MPESPPIRAAWKFCPRCGSSDTLHGENPFRCRPCHYQHYFTPIGAVGGLMVDQQQQMLFIVRGRNPGKGKLGLPGGFIDPGETAEAAMQREIREETGFRIDGGEYLASFPNQYDFAGVVADVTDLFFVVGVSDLSGGVPQDGEVQKIELHRPETLSPDDLAFSTHWKALQAYQRQHDR